MPLPSVVRCPVCSTSHVPQRGQLGNGVYASNCENCGFFFKFRATQPTASSVTFTVNGETYSVGNEYDPATSLNEYLRMNGISTGTKQLCTEGGCGVCLVAVRLFDPLSNGTKTYAINSCLAQLYMCDGWEITTIEGIGSPNTQLHPVQERLAKHNGSQCGFCSPSHVMNIYGFLQNNPTPTQQQIEDNVDSTICRCTGYRPILDAMKSFAVDAPPSLQGGPVDIEDLKPKMCKKSGQPCTGRCSQDKVDGEKKNCVGRSVHIVGARAQWFKPNTLPELYQLLKQYRDANYRLVFGNSGFGIYKEIGPWMYDVLIDIRGIQELYNIGVGSSIVVGANVSLTNLLELFERESSAPATRAYYPAFVDHMKQVATNTIRNVSSWAGNLMLKHKHPFFISDIFTMFETVGTQLEIADGDGQSTRVNLTDFLALDMKGKVVTAAILPNYVNEPARRIRTCRVAQRLQLCHGYVLAGFNFKLDQAHNYTVTEKPAIVFQGIDTNFNHATQTETYLTGKQLGDPQVLQGALNTLKNELNPMSDPVLASPEYRRNLACALFYKYVLGVMPEKVAQRYRSGATELVRPVSSGVQNYGSRRDEYPLTEPIMKLEAEYQTSGVSKFVNDLPLVHGELYAAFAVSTQGNATIASVDTSVAMTIPGVVKIIQAADIPAGGKNNFMPQSIFPEEEEVLCSGKVLYAGQPIAIVVADNPDYARTAAAMVKVTYSNVQPPILDLQQAIQQQSFFPEKPDPLIKGDADAAIRQSSARVTGSLQMGTQYHFYLEAHTSRCVPSDDGGMEVNASTQWADGAQGVVAGILNIPESSVTVTVKRIGGGFGGKLFRSHLVTAACALAAQLTQKPVRMKLDIHTNMKAVGKRWPYVAQYEAGFTSEGRLNGVRLHVYAEGGCSYNENPFVWMGGFVDNAYYCENWKVEYTGVKTNKPANTACRSPGSLPAQFMMETIMEHVAKYLNKDPSEVRKLNLYSTGQETPLGDILPFCNIRELVSQLETSADLANRKDQIAQYNQANRWKKRGLSLVPTRFPIFWTGGVFGVQVTVYHGDGTVMVDHGGIEMGQGINTKVAQVCAYELGVPLSSVRVKRNTTITNANSTMTGGSIGSELNCMAVIECCRTIKARMEPVRQKMDHPTWQDLVTKCWRDGVDLSAHYFTDPSESGSFRYNVYAAVATEVELDVLTGQAQINRADLVYDGGESMNPEMDVGQIEGGFVMGLGYHLMEKMKYDPKTGVALTDGTWEYKPPLPKDIPVDFRVSLMKNVPNPLGILRSKATGEPPVVLASSALYAIYHAAAAARAEIGQDRFIPINTPALVEDRQTLCLVDPSQFTFGQ